MLRDNGEKRYDRAEIKNRAREIVSYYLGAGHSEGDARVVWDCPACGKVKKLSLRLEDNLFGCFIEGCELHKADALAFIAFEEKLHSKRDFVRVLERAYEILGLDRDTTIPGGTGAGESSRSHDAARKVPQRERPKQTPEDRGKVLRERLAQCNEVYSRIMQLCPLEERDCRYLRRRGLSYPTIERGAFGSISAERARYLKKTLLKEFDEAKLIEVPGFFQDGGTKKLGFTLTGDYLLIPYHDRQGRITTIEGRARGTVEKGMGKYVSLRGAGSHLYVFPGIAPENIEAFTEGSFGALVAAENGIPVGSIQGCERYRASSSSSAPDGERGGPLLELRDVGFGGRTIPYIPDADDPPNENVLKAARKAAHHLVERQGGRATLCSLPKGLDLDEWLLSIPKDRRRESFRGLISGATPLEKADEWEEQRGGGDRKRQAPESAGTQTEEGVEPEPVREAPVVPGGQGSEDLEEAAQQDGAAANPESLPRAERDEQGGPSAAGQADFESGLAGDDSNSDQDAETTVDTHQRSLCYINAAQRHRDRVYRRLLEHAPLKREHRDALAALGVLPEAAKIACLGSLDEETISRAEARLKIEFGGKQLLRVPGFERGHSGRITFGLPKTKEYVLFPLFEEVLVEISSDAVQSVEGRGAEERDSAAEVQRVVSAVEALEYDPEKGVFPDSDRTLRLKGAGAHLYAFPAYSPGEIEGFCEGPLGALLAAQEDVVLGALGHFRRYTRDGGSADNREQVGGALPQLAGVDFGGREISYVPKTGPGEENARSRETRNALTFLVEKHNGVPRLSSPSIPVEAEGRISEHGGSGEEGEEPRQLPAASLSERLLQLPEDERHERLREAFPESPNRARPAATDEAGESEEETGDGEGAPFSLPRLVLPSGRALAAMVVASLLACVLTFFAAGRLEAFSQYVEVGSDGQPTLGGGVTGQIRLIMSQEPFTSVYEWRGIVSLMAGAGCFVAGGLRWNGRRRLEAISLELQSHDEGPWRAHLPGAGSEDDPDGSGREASSSPAWQDFEVFGIVNARGLVDGLVAAGVLYGVFYLALPLVKGLHGVLAALGVSGGSSEQFVAGAMALAALAAFVGGLYTTIRRSAIRAQKRKILNGSYTS